MLSYQTRNCRVWYQNVKYGSVKTRATLFLPDKINVSDRMGRKSKSFVLAFSNFRSCYSRISNGLLNGLNTHIRNVKLKHLRVFQYTWWTPARSLGVSYFYVWRPEFPSWHLDFDVEPLCHCYHKSQCRAGTEKTSSAIWQNPKTSFADVIPKRSL